MVHLMKNKTINNITVFLLSCFLFACGVNTNIGLTELDSRPALGKKITGTVTTSENEELDLESLVEKENFVLIFAQDTCTTCSHEATEISKKIESLGKLPDNTEILTYLVGLKGKFALEDAQDWKRNHKIQWTVTIQNGEDDIFRKYFSGAVKVPSILIQKDDKVFFQHTGALGVEEIEKQTGAWE